MKEQQYYLLAADHSYRCANLVWWCPNGRGYTQDLNKAGLYTYDQIDSFYWRENSETIPVKKEVVDAIYAPRSIRHEHANLEALGVNVEQWQTNKYMPVGKGR